MSNSKAERYRRFIRNYGQIQFRFRFCRSKFRRFLSKRLDSESTVEILPGLRMKFSFLYRDSKKFLPPELLFWQHEEWEAALQWLIRSMLPIGGTFFDVGSNSGIMGFLASYYRNSEVYLFEPHPRLVSLLHENIELNELRNCHVVSDAMSDKEGTLTLFESPEADSTHTIEHPESREGWKNIEVNTRRLDAFIDEKQLRQIDLMKVDCEGADFLVLEGLGEHLNPEKVRMFYIEDNKDSTVDLMKSRGYTSFNSRFYYIDKLRRINQTASDFFVAGDSKVKANALWVPKGSAEEAFLNTQQRFR